MTDAKPTGRGAERDAVGRAAHEAWKGWIVQGRYADHEFLRRDGGLFGYCEEDGCYKTDAFHHPDMVPWDDLPESKRGKYIETGMAGYSLAEAIAHEWQGQAQRASADLRTAEADLAALREDRDRWMVAVDNVTWKGMEAEREAAVLWARLAELEGASTELVDALIGCLDQIYAVEVWRIGDEALLADWPKELRITRALKGLDAALDGGTAEQESAG